VAAPGLKVNAFASGLKHPHWICVLPNGDVTVAKALSLPEPRHSPGRVHRLFPYRLRDIDMRHH